MPPSPRSTAHRLADRVGALDVRDRRRLRRIVRELAAERPEARVAVVVDPGSADLERVVTTAWPGADLLRVRRRRWGREHLTLAVDGQLDAIVDLAGGDARERFAGLFLHLRPGGHYLRRRPARLLEQLLRRLAQVRRRTGGAAPRPKAGRRRERSGERNATVALAAAVAGVERRPGWLLVRNAADALVNVREEEANDLLTRRPEVGTVLVTRPGASFEVRSTVRSSSADRLAQLPGRYDAPELSVRAWSDVTVLPRMVALRDRLVLPQTFRHIARPHLHTIVLADWGPRFAGAPEVTAEELPGTYFHLDSEFRGHFGHALAEQIAMLWGWQHVREHDPSARVLLSLGKHGPLKAWERTLWEAGGIPASALVAIAGPVRVTTLYSATRMLSEPQYVHPDLRETYDALGAALARQAGPGPWPRRVFLTRSGDRRSCTNTADVEKVFADAGFEVLRPELLPLPDQARLVREAEVIAGFAGSGMFQVALTGAPKHVIQVGSESYRRDNEYLMSATVGHRLDLVLCRAEETPGVVPAHADYTFDPAREGVFLREVLAELDR